ncbi:WG repeat-containing protein [Paenibacillus rhizoplanae]
MDTLILPGKMVIKAQYNSAEDFSEGAALVTINGTSHYIDKKGKFFCSIQAIKKRGVFLGGIGGC